MLLQEAELPSGVIGWHAIVVVTSLFVLTQQGLFSNHYTRQCRKGAHNTWTGWPPSVNWFVVPQRRTEQLCGAVCGSWWWLCHGHPVPLHCLGIQAETPPLLLVVPLFWGLPGSFIHLKPFLRFTKPFLSSAHHRSFCFQVAQDHRPHPPPPCTACLHIPPGDPPPPPSALSMTRGDRVMVVRSRNADRRTTFFGGMASASGVAFMSYTAILVHVGCCCHHCHLCFCRGHQQTDFPPPAPTQFCCPVHQTLWKRSTHRSLKRNAIHEVIAWCMSSLGADKRPCWCHTFLFE